MLNSQLYLHQQAQPSLQVSSGIVQQETHYLNIRKCSDVILNALVTDMYLIHLYQDHMHVHNIMHINCFMDFFVAGAVCYYKICTCIHTLHRVHEHGPITLLNINILTRQHKQIKSVLTHRNALCSICTQCNNQCSIHMPIVQQHCK